MNPYSFLHLQIFRTRFYEESQKNKIYLGKTFFTRYYMAI